MIEMNASWSYSFIIRQASSLRWPAYLLFLILLLLVPSHSVQQRQRFKPSSEHRHSQPRGAGGQSKAICFLLSFLRPVRRDSLRIVDCGLRIEDGGSRIGDRGSRRLFDPRSSIPDPRSSVFASISLSESNNSPGKSSGQSSSSSSPSESLELTTTAQAPPSAAGSMSGAPPATMRNLGLSRSDSADGRNAPEWSSSVCPCCAAEPAALNGALGEGISRGMPSLSGSALLGRFAIRPAHNLWRWREHDGAVAGKPILQSDPPAAPPRSQRAPPSRPVSCRSPTHPSSPPISSPAVCPYIEAPDVSVESPDRPE